MIVTSIQQVVSYVRDCFQTATYKTLVDEKTNQTYVTCEVYTQKGVVEITPDKGQVIDKKS